MTDTLAIYLVLLETSGNQAYVFQTNKLREVVGASEALFRAGTLAVTDALSKVAQVGVDLTHLGSQARIESAPTILIEVIAATSGKCLLLVRSKALAQAVVAHWSRSLLANYPGVDASGAISALPVDLAAVSAGEPADGAGSFSLPQAIANVHAGHDVARTLRRSPLARFGQSPMVSICRHSGLPAAMTLYEAADKPETAFDGSWVVQQKRGLTEDALSRFGNLLPRHEKFVRNIGDLERMADGDWLAVVHADGNGLGSLFLNLATVMDAVRDETRQALGLPKGVSPGRQFLECYRNLSAGVEAATKRSLDAALDHIEVQWSAGRARLAFLPLVLGGDDLTAVMTGQHALHFTVEYQRAFLRFSADPAVSGVLPILTRKFQGAAGLGTGAGVAIVKPHFPFSAAYELANDLCTSAKQVKDYERYGDQPWPAAALDFHLLYDSTLPGLGAIRDRLISADRFCRLTAKPFVIDVAGKAPEAWSEWSRAHDWRSFEGACRALTAKSPASGQLLLPRSQSHALRQMLFTAPKATITAQWKRIAHTYSGFADAWPNRTVSGEPKLTIACPAVQSGDPKLTTAFLDALEVAGTWAVATADSNTASKHAAAPHQG